MIVACSHCGTKFNLPDEKMKPGGVKIRCTKCSNIFDVPGPESTPPVDQTPPPPPQEQVNTGGQDEAAGGDDMGLDLGDDSDFDFDDDIAAGDDGIDVSAGFDEGLDDGMADDFGDGAADSFDNGFGDDLASDTDTDLDLGMDDDVTGAPDEQIGGPEDDGLTIDDDFGLEDGGGEGDSLLDDDFGMDDSGGGDSLPDDDFGLEDGGGEGDSLLDDDFGMEDGGGGDSLLDDDFGLEGDGEGGDSLLDDDFGMEDGGGVEAGAEDGMDFSLSDGAEDGASDDGLDLGFGEDELISSGGDDFAIGDSLGFEDKSIDTEFGFDDGGMSLPGDQLIMPKKKGRRRSPLLVGLGIFLVLLAGIYFVSNIFLEDGVTELLTLVDNFGKREVDPLEKLTIIQNNITHYYINNNEKGKALVVEGVIINNSDVPKGHIQVRLTLYDSTGAGIGTHTAYCGNILTVNELESFSGDQIQVRLDQPTGDEMSNARVDPGKTVKFMMVIFDIPENTAGYEVIILNAQNVG